MIYKIGTAGSGPGCSAAAATAEAAAGFSGTVHSVQ